MTRPGRKRSSRKINKGNACHRCAELLGITVNRLREMARVAPDSNLVSTAKQKGISHLIKALDQEMRFIPQGQGRNKTLVRVVRTKLEVVDPQKAIRQLMKLYGLKNLSKKPT